MERELGFERCYICGCIASYKIFSYDKSVSGYTCTSHMRELGEKLGGFIWVSSVFDGFEYPWKTEE
ncbi:MAG: hypothetical protein DRP12_02980 [Candidatus Aenigmatarchaeota archaeon]|nr:MAG: hypothetical protein DRP12_02980 [Candidatus Aenigmarchaeota archaeon]